MKFQSMEYMLLFFCMSALFKEALTAGSFQDYLQAQKLEKSSIYDCNLTIHTQYGYIRSPGHPGKYPRYTRCEYIVQKISQNVCTLKLTFEWFEVARMYFTNCSADFFELQDLENRKRICGELSSGTTRSVRFPENSDKLIFRFQSTFHQNRGFSIRVKQLLHSCGKERHKPHPKVIPHITFSRVTTPPPSCDKVIGSRIGRLSYQEGRGAPSRTCTYRIRKSEPRACVVQLDFSTFDVSRSVECMTDYLLMPSGRRLCGQLGGSRKFLQYPAAQNEIVIAFTSTKGNLNSFDIQVVQLPGPCDNFLGLNATGPHSQQCDQNVIGLSGSIRSPGFPGAFGPNYRCIYRIFRQDHSICQLELDFRSFSVGKHNPPGCGKGAFLELPGRNRLCKDIGGKMTVRVQEFNDPVVFTFQSDSQSSGAGFHIAVTQIPNTCPGYVVRPDIPPPQSRCYQEVDSHLGYFSPQSAGPRIMRCEFVIKKADPSVCNVWLQISSSNRFHPVPCMQNFIQLPSGDRMCASITERREINFPKESDVLTLIYYNLDNPQFNLIVSQIQNTCRIPSTVSYSAMNLRWRNP